MKCNCKHHLDSCSVCERPQYAPAEDTFEITQLKEKVIEAAIKQVHFDRRFLSDEIIEAVTALQKANNNE